ncbi:MAG TPA: hypothetical protein VHL80_11905 [Polyangia bacterium]|nr:hypothetical protein [Polyangia bacterium]
MGLRVASTRTLAAAFAALTAVLLGAPGCGPSIDPAAQADLDRKLSQIQTSEETFPPSESYSPMAFVVGQWTEHRVTDEKGRKTLITNKLVGQEAGAYWFEVVNESAQGRDAAKMLVALSAGRDPAGMEIRTLLVRRGDAQPTVVDPVTGDPQIRARARAALDLIAVPGEGDEKDDVRVPGGHFIGCYRIDTQGAWGPLQTPTDLCTHPSVPLSGVVRAISATKPGLVELVTFGVTGAESVF